MVQGWVSCVRVYICVYTCVCGWWGGRRRRMGGVDIGL